MTQLPLELNATGNALAVDIAERHLRRAFSVQHFRPRLGYFQTCLCLSVRVWIVESTAVRAGIVTAGRPVVRRGRHWRYVARGSVVYPRLKLLQRRDLAIGQN